VDTLNHPCRWRKKKGGGGDEWPVICRCEGGKESPGKKRGKGKGWSYPKEKKGALCAFLPPFPRAGERSKHERGRTINSFIFMSRGKKEFTQYRPYRRSPGKKTRSWGGGRGGKRSRFSTIYPIGYRGGEKKERKKYCVLPTSGPKDAREGRGTTQGEGKKGWICLSSAMQGRKEKENAAATSAGK